MKVLLNIGKNDRYFKYNDDNDILFPLRCSQKTIPTTNLTSAES